MSNPYNEDPYATAWQQGYDTGMQNPSATAPDFASWDFDEDTTRNLTTAWEEGATAGRELGSTGAGGGPDPTYEPAPHDPGAHVDVPQPAAQAPARVHTVKFWINAFIEPAHVDGPPGYGLVYDYEYFSGDGRGFSDEIHASARLHSEVEISGIAEGNPVIAGQYHACGASHALDSSLNIVDTKTATPRASFDQVSMSGGHVTVGYTGAANMPLITGSPDIDMHGTFSVDVATGVVQFSGMIDAFPWYEAYAAVNGGSPVTLFAENPTGSGPLDLMGDANRGVYGTANGLE